MQISLFANLGFVTQFEGLKYIDDANQWLALQSLNHLRIFYSAYSLLLALLFFLGFGSKAMLFIHLIFNAIATIRFYQLSFILSKNKIVAALSTLLLIGSVQTQMWNFYLGTEALFTAFLIFYTYQLLIYGFDSWSNNLILSILFLIISFIRPNGVLVVVPTLLYFALVNHQQWRLKLLLNPIWLTFAFVLVINWIFNRGHFSEYVGIALKHNWVIWGYNEPIGALNANSNSVIHIWLVRALYYFSMFRPYYSTAHNLLIMTFYPIYLLIILGLFNRQQINRHRYWFILSIILIMSGFSIISFLEWHGRFIAPILPFMVLMANNGITYLVDYWNGLKTRLKI
jgi:hypothetical protein